MKSTRKNAPTVAFVSIFALGVLLVLTCGAPSARPQTSPVVNPPPCDFNDNFYNGNGINVSNLNLQVAGRFGTFRQTGPPASSFNGGTNNWVPDSTCGVNDPTRRNFRILATTGGYGNFEAYAALKQRLPNGTFALTPCGTMGTGATPCFPVTSVATPNLRQDWRFSTNRNAIDGSDANRVSGTGSGATIVNNSPFGYFCDDLLGMWIITYFWFTVDPANPGTTCGPILAALDQKNGVNLDGTPIIKTADELNNQLEANHCGAEGQEDVGGADGGAVWLVCPAIPDPRQGGIAPDAFPDVVFKPDGTPLDPPIINNFRCLQTTGQFCN